MDPPPGVPLIFKHIPAGRQEGIPGSQVRSWSPSAGLRLFYRGNSSCPLWEDVPLLPTCSSRTSLSHFSSHDSVLSSLSCSCLVQAVVARWGHWGKAQRGGRAGASPGCALCLSRLVSRGAMLWWEGAVRILWTLGGGGKAPGTVGMGSAMPGDKAHLTAANMAWPPAPRGHRCLSQHHHS